MGVGPAGEPNVSMRLGDDHANKQKQAKQFNKELNDANETVDDDAAPSQAAPPRKALGELQTTGSLVTGPKFTDEQIYGGTDAASKRIDDQIAEDRAISENPYKNRLQNARTGVSHSMDTWKMQDNAAKMTGDMVWSYGQNNTWTDKQGKERPFFTEGEKKAVYKDTNSLKQLAEQENKEANERERTRVQIARDDQVKAGFDRIRSPAATLQPFAFAAIGAPAFAVYAGSQTGKALGDAYNACKDGPTTDCLAATTHAGIAVATDYYALKPGAQSKSPQVDASVAGNISGRKLPDSPATTEPKVIVDPRAYDVGPSSAAQTKALGMDPAKTKVVANASDGHGADFQVVVSGDHPRKPAGSITAAGGTAGTGVNGAPSSTTASKTELLGQREQISSRLTQVRANIRSDGDVVDTFSDRPPSTNQAKKNLEAAETRLKASEGEEKDLAARLVKVDADLATINGQKSIGELNVPQQATRYRKGTVDVESWRPDVYLASDRAAHRKGVEKLMQAEPSGDLSKALLDGNGKMYPARAAGQDLQYLRQHPEVWESSHALTRGEGKDVLVISSSYRNQMRGGQLEHTGKVLSDRALVIQGMAIDPLTAWDLVAARKLDASVVKNAKSIALVR